MSLRRLSLRARLVFAATYILLVVVVALEIPFAIDIDRRAAKESETGLLQNAALVASRVNDDVPKAGNDPAVPPNPPAAIASIAEATARVSDARFVVTDATGRVLADSSRQVSVGTQFATPERPELRNVFAVRGGQIDITRRFSDTLGQELLIVTVPVIHNREAIGAVRASESLRAVEHRVHRVWLGLGLIGLGVVLVGLILAYALATSLARPVRRLEEAAVALGEGDLDARAPERGPKEIATLAHSFNRMAGALSSNLAAQKDFLANASHQLRTPLTGLKLRLEAIEAGGGPEAGQATKAQVEVDRMAGMVDDLLELARASSVGATGTAVDAGKVAGEAVERWRPPAERAGKEVRLEGGGPATVWTDPTDLVHVLDNLIENAIRYTPPGTAIKVRVSGAGGATTITVADTGPGIPDEERDRMFDRFYRGAAGRRAGPGTGLGLAIVSELVSRWGGKIHVSNGTGTSIDVTFPKKPALS